MTRAVLDTNTVLSASTSENERSASREIIARWNARVIQILWCDDMLIEYAEVLIREGVSIEHTKDLIRIFRDQGERIDLVHFHESPYPEDIDDVYFLLCALNGHASHIVTHDKHLHDIAAEYRNEVRICYPGQFIGELNEQIRMVITNALSRGLIEGDADKVFDELIRNGQKLNAIEAL